MMEHLCYSRNHVGIVFDSEHSHVATHFEDTPALKSAVVKAIQETDVEGNRMFFEYDLGRVIGTTDLVETTEHDKIVYAKRKNRDTYTRFTKSQQPRDCSTVTIRLDRQDDNTYILWSAWIGYIGPSFPDDKEASPDSRAYWDKHALVWGRQEIQEDTETSVCPW